MPNAQTFRTIYQQSNLFVAPSGLLGNGATGQMFAGGNVGVNLVGELSRIQSCDLSATINRMDVNEFGVLRRIDSEIIAAPQFNLGFSYYLTDGSNESILGLSAKGGASFVSGLLTKVSESKNYFISYSPPGVDDDGNAVPATRDVAAIGNGYISNYSINAAVGQPVTVSVSVEGMNVASFNAATGVSPAIIPQTAQRVSTWNWALPTGTPYTGANVVSILKPGDITLSIPNAAGFLSYVSGSFAAPLQSISLSIPIGRERIQMLGSPFGASNEINWPVNCSMSCQGLHTNIQANSADALICSDDPFDVAVTLRQPSCNGTGATAFVINFNKAYMSNYRVSQSIGGNASLSFDLSSQLQGPTALDGIVISGYNAA